jgi:hypothetical protein
MSSNVVLPCGAMRVAFQRIGDRIGHRIEIFSNDQWLPVLESLEGDAKDDWPKSPPLQTLHVESRPEGPVALLVGMAGTSHWSASVAADEGQSKLTFDIACRISNEPEWIGTTYRWLVANEHPLRQAIQFVTASAIIRNINETIEIIPEPQQRRARTVRWVYAVLAVA